MSLAERRYSQLVRISAIYDGVVALPFATPWTFGLIHQLLNLIAPMANFLPEHAVFANLMGSVIVVWSALRAYKPDPLFGLFDSFARVLFVTWQLYYLLVYKITPVMWFIAFFEALFLILQGYGYWLLYKVRRPTESSCKIVKYYKDK